MKYKLGEKVWISSGFEWVKGKVIAGEVGPGNIPFYLVKFRGDGIFKTVEGRTEELLMKVIEK